jgi:signal transduction histidine kinase
MNSPASPRTDNASRLRGTTRSDAALPRGDLARSLALQALSEPDLESFLRYALGRIRAELGVELVEVALSSEDSRSLVRIAGAGFADEGNVSLSLDAELSEIVATGQVVMFGPGLRRALPLPVAGGAISGSWLPLATGQRVYGVLGAYSKGDSTPLKETLFLLCDVAAIFARAIERRQREDQRAHELESRALRKNEEAICRAQRLASLGRFAAGIAHELTNPLTSILLGAESGLRTEDPIRARRALDSILKNAERCSRIMDSVLQFAREEESTRWITDVNRLLERVALLAQNEVQAHRLKVKFDLERCLTPVFANPTELEQAFISILRNAVEAKNGRATRVAIRSENVPKGIRITVADDGPGIPVEHLAEIFDPFFSTQRRAGGTGLGLSITQRILAAHDGSIYAMNQPGGGAFFVIELPAARP